MAMAPQQETRVEKMSLKQIDALAQQMLGVSLSDYLKESESEQMTRLEMLSRNDRMRLQQLMQRHEILSKKGGILKVLKKNWGKLLLVGAALAVPTAGYLQSIGKIDIAKWIPAEKMPKLAKFMSEKVAPMMKKIGEFAPVKWVGDNIAALGGSIGVLLGVRAPKSGFEYSIAAWKKGISPKNIEVKEHTDAAGRKGLQYLWKKDGKLLSADEANIFERAKEYGKLMADKKAAMLAKGKEMADKAKAALKPKDKK